MERCADNSDEMSDFHCATRNEGKGIAPCSVGSPTFFDSQVGSIGSVVDECESEMEFERASLAEGRPRKYAGGDGLA